MDEVVEISACDECGAEYTINYDYSEIQEEPIFCPFCGHQADDYILDDDSDEYYFDEE